MKSPVRAYGLFALSIAVLFTLTCRAREEHGAAPRGHPVLFVGLDGGDWQLLDRYVADGTMPNLAALAREGTTGVLTTLHPPLSPLVWTTMMTGVGPIEHGILDFTRLHPATGTREPISSADRRVPAVWNMATLEGRSVAVFGLWATYPAEPVDGVVVSDRLFSFQAHETTPARDVVAPADREAWARGILEESERSVGFDAVHEYLPWLDEAAYGGLLGASDPYARPVGALRRILVETRVYHALAVSWLREHRPDLAVVYIQGTDTIGHVFAPYVPPRRPGVSEDDVRRYGDVPRRYFAEIDSLLSEYRKLAASSGAVLMIASDHGFQWAESRPDAAASATATAGKWHRDEGIFLLWGPGIAPSAGPRQGGRVEQVCATLLAILGLPRGKGIEGPPLAGIPASDAVADYAASPWRKARRDDAPVPGDAAEAIAKLRSLGYIGAGEPAASPKGEAGSTRTSGSYNNEGLILREKGKRTEAVAAFEKALALDPRSAAALWNLSETLQAEGADLDRSDALLLDAISAGAVDGAEHAVARVIAYHRSGKPERGLVLLDRALVLRPADPHLWLHRARYRIDRKECEKALSDATRAIALAPTSALGPATAGLARLCLGDPEGARRDFRSSLRLDPDQPELTRFLADGR